MSEWRYTPQGRLLHAIRHVSDYAALCGVSVVAAAAWHGTGTQDEYEHAGVLPKCPRCIAKGGR